MMSALFMGIQRTCLAVLLSFSFTVVTPSFAGASDTAKSAVGARSRFSADDFDWRDMVPSLLAATTLPGDQAVTALLENSKVLRSYFANEIWMECKTNKRPCAIGSNSSNLDSEVNKRIAQIVQEGIFHRNKNTVVDYQLTQRPFPFSEIAAVKSEKKPEAYVMLALADRSYKAADLQDKYGAPFDTNIFQWYSVFKYRIKNSDYTSDAVFEVDPVDGAVIKVAVSLKPKKHH
jgi:hypothetical protein